MEAGVRFPAQLVNQHPAEKELNLLFLKGLRGYLEDRVPAHVLVNVWEDEGRIYASTTGDPMQPSKMFNIDRERARNMGWQDAGSYLLKKIKAR